MGELVRARFLEFERGIVERLRSSCRHMRDDEFRALARTIALRDFRTYLPPRLYEELVDQLSREGRSAGSR